MYGKIKSIEEIRSFSSGNMALPEGSNGASLGFLGMMHGLSGERSMDGYEVIAGENVIHLLIDNMQSYCEMWGYFSSDDDLDYYKGAKLRDIEITDKARTTKSIPEDLEYMDAGGIMFVTFKTDRGPFQLSVYNAHNGYYGHGIIIAVNNEIKLSDTL